MRYVGQLRPATDFEEESLTQEYQYRTSDGLPVMYRAGRLRDGSGWAIHTYLLPGATWTADKARAFLLQMGARTVQEDHESPSRGLVAGRRGLAVASGPRMGTFMPLVDGAAVVGDDERLYMKDIIGVGVYTHPVDGWTLDVTRERMDKWVRAFKLMRENGVIVPVTKDHRTDAESKLGEIIDLVRDGDILRGVHKIKGKEAQLLVEKVGTTSLELELDFTDGLGRKYGEAITANSVVLQPVYPGQEGFQAIAASLQSRRMEYLFSQGSNAMKELIEKWRKLLSLADTVSDEEVLQKMDAHVETIQALITSHLDKIASLEKEVSALKALTTNGGEPELPAEVIEDRIEQVDAGVEELVKAGIVTPDLGKQLKFHLIGSDTERNTFMMSRTKTATADGKRPVRALALLNIIKQIKPMKFGTQTPAQRINASLDGTEPSYDPNLTKSMADMVYGQRS